MSKQLSMIIFTVSFISGVYNETTNEIITGGVGNITVSPFLKFYCFSLQQLLAWTCMMFILFIRMPDNSSVLPNPVFFLIWYFFIYLFIYLFQCWSFRYGAKFLLQRKVLSVSVLIVIVTCVYQFYTFWLPLP